MEGFILSRVGKPALMLLITFFSVRFMTGSVVDGVLVGLVPALLGATNVFASTGYSLTALSLILAVVFAVTPPFVKAPITHFASDTWRDVTHSPGPPPAAVAVAAPAAPLTPVPATPTPATPTAAPAAPPPATVTTTTKASSSSTTSSKPK